MRIHRKSNPRGIALIIVMIMILVMGIVAGGFAYSMKVETKLARNTSFEPDLEWIGRSGVEMARWILAQQMMIPTERWDSLNQKWAGGPMGTNEALANVSLENNPLGEGSFTIKITDLERKFNINTINPGNTFILEQALNSVGADSAQVPSIVAAFLDWRDPDDDIKMGGGAESQDYELNPNPGYPPYMAKNGPIDDIAELLLVRGITPEMFWGSRPPGSDSAAAAAMPPQDTSPLGLAASFGGGLVDVFTAVSSGQVNLNTAPSQVLQLIPGVDGALAQAIIATRAGPDGTDGTEDDMPFASPGELINVPGMSREIVNVIQRFFNVRSSTFEVQVEAQVSQYKRTFVAVVLRRSPRDIQTLYFHWK